MTIRYQQQSEKYPYASPTTPGLYVTFRSYIIELICLNVNKKIGPRFWSDLKYWGPKFRREVKGVDNVLKDLGTIDTFVQTALVYIIREHNIKSLMYKITVKRVVINVRRKKEDLKKQRINLSKKSVQVVIDLKKNSIFVDGNEKSILAKVREAENG